MINKLFVIQITVAHRNFNFASIHIARAFVVTTPLVRSASHFWVVLKARHRLPSHEARYASSSKIVRCRVVTY